MYSELISNKRVVLVSSAPYLKDKNIGNIINSYDTVIRINRGTNLIQDPNYGNRTDILYHCLCQKTGGELTREIYDKYKYIVGTIPPFYPVDKRIRESSFPNGYKHMHDKIPKFYTDKFTYINKEEYLDLEEKIGCRPYTGITTLYNILKLKPKELYITGMTFGKGGSNNLYRKNNTTKDWINSTKKGYYPKCHDNYLIWLYTKKMIKNSETKITLDDELKEILDFDIEKYRKRLNLHNLTDNEIYIHFLLN